MPDCDAQILVNVNTNIATLLGESHSYAKTFTPGNVGCIFRSADHSLDLQVDETVLRDYVHTSSSTARTEIMELVEQRIADLRGYAIEDGQEIDETSLARMMTFIRGSATLNGIPGITFGDDGMMSVEWENEAGEWIGARWVGEGTVSVALMGKRSDERYRTKEAKMIPDQELEGFISANRLMHLL